MKLEVSMKIVGYIIIVQLILACPYSNRNNYGLLVLGLLKWNLYTLDKLIFEGCAC